MFNATWVWHQVVLAVLVRDLDGMALNGLAPVLHLDKAMIKTNIKVVRPIKSIQMYSNVLCHRMLSGKTADCSRRVQEHESWDFEVPASFQMKSLWMRSGERSTLSQIHIMSHHQSSTFDLVPSVLAHFKDYCIIIHPPSNVHDMHVINAHVYILQCTTLDPKTLKQIKQEKHRAWI